MKTAWIVAVALSAAVLAGAGGCAGYTTASQYRPDVSTVAVSIFQRGTEEYRRDIEIRLTEAISKRIEQETPYKVVDRDHADTELTGTLTRVTKTPLAFDPRTGEAREFQVRLIVDFVWKDLRTGKELAKRTAMPVAAGYVPEDPFSHDFFQGSEDALNRMAARVVENMANPW